MKVLSLISSVLLALSLAGAAQAHAAGPDKSTTAPATIELAQCDAGAATSCGLGGASAVKTAEVDVHTLPSAAPKRQPKDDPVSPVPEPHTFVMLMLGLVVLGLASRRREPTETFKD